MPVYIPEGYQDASNPEVIPPEQATMPLPPTDDQGVTDFEVLKDFYFSDRNKDIYGKDIDFRDPDLEDKTPVSGVLSNPYVPDIFKKSAIKNAQIDEALDAATGGNYNKEKTFGDTAFDIANAADIGKSYTLEDKVKKFQEKYPEGEISIHDFNGNKYLLLRKNSAEKWTKMGVFSSQVLPNAVSLQTAAGIVGEGVLGAAGNRLAPGLGVFTGAAGAVAGSWLGSAGDRLIEKERGYNTSGALSSEEDMKTAITNGAISFITRGGATMGAMKATLDSGQTNPATRRAIEFAKKEGLPIPTVGEASTSGETQAIYSQVLRMNRGAMDEHMAKRTAVMDKLMRLVNKYGFDGVETSQLNNLLETNRNALYETINGIREGRIGYEEGGKTLQKLFGDWDNLLNGKGGFIDRKYKLATSLGDDISIDMSGPKKKVNELIDGVQGAGETVEVPSPVLGPDGKPLGTMSHTPDVKLTEDPKGELLSAMEAVQQLKPIITKHNAANGEIYSAYEQLKAIRTRFGRLTNSNDPGVAANAKQMYEALNDSFDTATLNTTGMPPEKAQAFIDAWKDANASYKSYKELSDLKVIGKLDNMEVGDFTNFSQNVLRPGAYDKLKLVAEATPGGQDIMKGMFVTKLLSGERTSTWRNSIQKTFDDFRNMDDMKSLDFLMDPNTRNQMLEYASKMDQLEGSKLAKIVNEDRDAAAHAFDIINTGTPADIKYMFKLAGGSNSPTAQSIKAGFLNKLVDDASMPIQKYGNVLVQNEMETILKKYHEKGVLQEIFSPKEIEWLMDTSNYAGVVGNISSHGAGLQIGQQAGLKLRQPIKALEALSQGKDPLPTVWKVLKLPIAAQLAGWYLMRSAKDGVKGGISGGSVPYVRWASMAANDATQAHDIDMKNVDTIIFNKIYAPDIAKSIPKHSQALKEFYFGNGGALSGE